jgi:ferredoxin
MQDVTDMIRLTINGRVVRTTPGASILTAQAYQGEAMTANVGCMGQGACGSCRCLIRRAGERQVVTALACETRAEAGMEVSFIDYYHPDHVHFYDLETVAKGWNLLDELHNVFHQSDHCRHCGGCDRACPKGLPVQSGVAAAVKGNLAEVVRIFDECVMCNLCTLACPENIRPNHLGLFIRRAVAAETQRPRDLIQRLREIESEAMSVNFSRDAAEQSACASETR